MFLSVLFFVLLLLVGLLVVTFFWLKSKNRISKDKKVTAIELINLFSALGGILAFIFVLTTYYVDKSEKNELRAENKRLIISDFIASLENNKNAIKHFKLTKAPGHNSEKTRILDYSYFVSLDTTQLDRLLSSGILNSPELFKNLLILSEAVKKYNKDLQQVRELNFPIIGKNMMERTHLLTIIEKDSDKIIELYKRASEKLPSL